MGNKSPYKWIYTDCFSDVEVYPVSEDEAAVVLQKLYRGFKMRRILSGMIARRVVKIKDADSGKGKLYFYRYKKRIEI